MKKLLLILLSPLLFATCSDDDNDETFRWIIIRTVTIAKADGTYLGVLIDDVYSEILSEKNAVNLITKKVPSEDRWIVLTDETQKEGDFKTRSITYKIDSKQGDGDFNLIYYYMELKKRVIN